MVNVFIWIGIFIVAIIMLTVPGVFAIAVNSNIYDDRVTGVLVAALIGDAFALIAIIAKAIGMFY